MRESDGSGASSGEGPSAGTEWIERNVELVRSQLSTQVDFEFGVDRRSLVWVEGFLERQRANPTAGAERLVPVLGSFLGQCLVENGGGRWVELADGWCVRLAGVDAFPFAKVAKQARDGVAAGESIVGFYDSTLALTATGRPSRPSA